MTNTNTIIGTTEDWDGCNCCGRTNLKVYIVIRGDEGDINYYGTSCAAAILNTDNAAIRKAVKAADDETAGSARRERAAARRIEDDRWFAWLVANGTGGEVVFTRIQSLGGPAAARAAYNNAG